MANEMVEYNTRYMAKKAFFSFMGSSFRIFSPEGQLRFFVKQKAFKLKEEITIFSDESRTTALLKINARSIMDFSATYDVTDAISGETIGALRRKGLKSIIRDEWIILGQGDQEIGTIIEDSGALAIVRRFLVNLIPQTFNVSIGTQQIGQIKQKFNPFILTYDIDFSNNNGAMDKRLGVAIVVLLLAIEGRQK